MKWLAIILLWPIAATSMAGGAPLPDKAIEMKAVKVEVVELDGKFKLLRDGKPYIVKGAGIHHTDFERFAAHGGNSFRTWAIEDGAQPPGQLLDRAHALGLTVSLCLQVARGRQGFDYDDPVAVARQAEQVRASVMAFKDHPALLTWIIGNELNYHYENPRVFDAVNDIALMIKQIDPNHPTTTALAGFDRRALNDIAERAPALDFVSFQMYGDLINLPTYIAETQFDRPYFVTEWGAVGHWEVFKTRWGAPVEQTSTEKAASYRKSYMQVLQPYQDQAIGNYVFLWGEKQERTGTWYGMFLDTGESTEAVDVMHHIWNGEWPANRAPRVSPVTLANQSAFDNVTLRPGQQYPASISAVDYDEDEIVYRWELREESSADQVGGDEELVPPLIEGAIANPALPEITLTAPAESGAYRLFVYVYDGNNQAGHANIPFYVE